MGTAGETAQSLKQKTPLKFTLECPEKNYEFFLDKGKFVNKRYKHILFECKGRRLIPKYVKRYTAY